MTKRKIYDCFTYDGEDCLELRLKTHWNKVDWFVIVEAQLTFSGIQKAFSFDAERFAWAMPKIRYLKLHADEFDACVSPWDRERLQRNALRRGFFDAAPDDVVIIADVDEIIRPEKMDPVAEGSIHVFEQLMLYFYCDYLLVSEPFWRKAVAVPGKFALSHEAEEIRNGKALRKKMHTVLIADGGWHFSYLGGMDLIEKKLDRFSHQNLNKPKYKDKQENLSRLYAGKDIYRRAKKWGRVSMNGAGFGNSVVNEWFSHHPELYSPAAIRSSGSLDSIIDKYRRQGAVTKRWEKLKLRLWNYF